MLRSKVDEGAHLSEPDDSACALPSQQDQHRVVASGINLSITAVGRDLATPRRESGKQQVGGYVKRSGVPS